MPRRAHKFGSERVRALSDYTRGFLTARDRKWVARPNLTQLVYQDDALWDDLIQSERQDYDRDTAIIRSRFQKMEQFIDKSPWESGLCHVVLHSPKMRYYYLPETNTDEVGVYEVGETPVIVKKRRAAFNPGRQRKPKATPPPEIVTPVMSTPQLHRDMSSEMMTSDDESASDDDEYDPEDNESMDDAPGEAQPYVYVLQHDTSSSRLSTPAAWIPLGIDETLCMTMPPVMFMSTPQYNTPRDLRMQSLLTPVRGTATDGGTSQLFHHHHGGHAAGGGAFLAPIHSSTGIPVPALLRAPAPAAPVLAGDTQARNEKVHSGHGSCPYEILRFACTGSGEVSVSRIDIMRRYFDLSSRGGDEGEKKAAYEHIMEHYNHESPQLICKRWQK
ncbi:hypothetical protein JKP88DRAFT_296239 [Tribonema minus]|uniref:Uncharacterized protein n=1 Tax=Tribonema minus TaxID=303371 RepID=A0A835ZFM5_9STRA|nr:hypothetical protein JKP88DRAFT_296239 [Tribonema minus]